MSILSVDQIQPIGSGTTITLNATEVKTGTEITVGTGASIFSPAGNTLTFGTNNEERIRIKNDGTVLIGTSTKGISNADDLTIATSGHTGLTIRSGQSNQGNIFFSDGTSGADEYRGYLQYEHTANTLIFGTDAVERLRIGSSGQIGLSGANYGDAGQVLTSQGSSSAPIWSATPLSFRNLIINGAMNVAQRGSSATTSAGYQTVDRFEVNHAGVAQSPSQSQATLTSAPGPYREGHRKAYKITNGNQGSAHNDAFIRFKTTLEAQDIANSGWDYTSSSSYITLSFWIKSSVAQNFYGRLQTDDGTARNYPFETGSLTANTWTKVIKTIPGSSSPALQFDNNVNAGLFLEIAAWYGTDYTGSMSLNTWATYSDRTPDYGAAMDDWYLTNDATLEITGVQLEVGSQATPFEHRSVGEELLRCQRYFQFVENAHAIARSSTNTGSVSAKFTCEMRAAPTISTMNLSTKATNVGLNLQGDSVVNTTQSSGNQGTSYSSQRSMYLYDMSGFGGMTAGRSYFVGVPANNGVVFTATSEL